MNIYVDESGTFPTTSTHSAWSVVVAYVSSDEDEAVVQKLVSGLKYLKGGIDEVKLRSLTEREYFNFLFVLGKLNGVVFAAASDMSTSPKEVMAHHQKMQALGVVKYRNKMEHQPAREALDELSQAVAVMPPNLYAQMKFQIRLFHEVVARSITYFVQRSPQSLERFRWRIDCKDVVPTAYEKVFRKLLPATLQSISIDEPILIIRQFDYSAMTRYEFGAGDKPTWLQGQYGLPDMEGFNLGKLVGEDFEFVDSKAVAGIQVADLLASGIRRFLKGEFQDNNIAAELLGRLTIQNVKNQLPIKLVSLGRGQVVDGELTRRLKMLEQYARPYFLKR
jgi:Protein of unknown function (DUF3800)